MRLQASITLNVCVVQGHVLVLLHNDRAFGGEVGVRWKRYKDFCDGSPV